jgi:glycine cleavage system H protein
MTGSTPETMSDLLHANLATSDLRFSSDHMWVRPSQAGGNIVRVGLSHFAVEALGELQSARLPSVGDRFEQHDPCGEIEANKSVSDLYAPVTGVVVAVNSALSADLDAVAADPYVDGWLFELDAAELAQIESLSIPSAYLTLMEGDRP